MNRFSQYFNLLLLFLGMTINANSRIALEGKAKPDSVISQYPYVRFVASDSLSMLERLTDDEFLDKAGRVVFKVNRFDAFTNDSLLRQLEHEIIPVINRDSMRLVRMVVRGAASPEGPYSNNVMLSRRRVQTLVDFFRSRMFLPVDDASLSVEAVAEDYDLLVAMMHRANDPDVQVVENLVKHHIPHKQYTLLKRRLQRLQHGRLWPRLLRTYFRELRSARIVLYFEPLPKVQAPVLIPISEKPTKDVSSAFLPPSQVSLPKQDERIPRREMLSIKTNLLFDFAWVPGYNDWCPIPNIALEYYPMHGHFTFGASIDFPWWQHYERHKYFEVRNYQLETRYYLRSGGIEKNPPGKGAAFRGWYLQGYVNGGIFCFCFNADKGWIGEAIGGGVGVGYVMPISAKGHWRLEFGAQFGILYSKYDPYQYEYRGIELNDHLYYYDWVLPAKDFKKRQYRYTWFGPTRVGVTLTYDLLYRRRSNKKKVSFKSYEYIERRVEK